MNAKRIGAILFSAAAFVLPIVADIATEKKREMETKKMIDERIAEALQNQAKES